MHSWFANISVTWKLAAGFGVVLILTTSIALIGWFSLNRLENNVERMSDISRLNESLTLLRVNRLEYILANGEEEAANAVRKALERFSELHDGIQSHFKISENQRLLAGQAVQIDSYRVSLGNIGTSYSEIEVARKKMQQQSQLFEQILEEIWLLVTRATLGGDQRFAQLQAISHLNRDWAAMRYQVRGYIARLEQGTEQKAMAAVQTAEDEIKKLRDQFGHDHGQQTVRLVAALEGYVAGVMDYRRARESIDLQLEALSNQGREIEGISGQLLQGQIELSESNADIALSLQLVATLVALLVGILAAWLITRQIILPLRETLGVVERIAGGDLRQSLEVARKDEIGLLQKGIQRMATTLRELIGGIRDGVGQITHAAEELLVVAEQTSARVNEQKVETDQVATAMHEMSATVQEVARNAADASQAAKNADHEAEVGDRVVDEAISRISSLATEVNRSSEAMEQLQQESQRISSVMDVIRSVAEQTNLLALNAAIEAARAGDAGRGFAVVADEVRGLAQRTQKSTEEIEELVASLQQGTQRVVEVMRSSRELTDSSVTLTRKAGDSLGSITRTVSGIHSMNQQIAAAAEQQSAVAEEISRSVVSVRDISEQTASASDETAKSSLQLKHLGTQLQTMVSRFRV